MHDNARDAGSAYEFCHDGLLWIQASKLSASVSSEIAKLGASVSISADVALIGASGDSENGVISGAAYVFNVALDTDGDGLADVDDNCPSDWNPLQENFDGDLLGDVCDRDDDNDGLDDDQDPAPYDALISAGPTPFTPVGNNILTGVDYEWVALPGATRYAIEVQHNGVVRAYEDMIIATLACNDGRCSYIKPDAALEGLNRWRLRSGTVSGTSDWSPWTEFVVNGSANPIVEENEDGIPATNVPMLPQTASPTGTAVELGTDFRWPTVAGATHYSIEIQHNGEIRGYALMLNAEQVCANGECVYIKSDATQLGNNRWRLKAGNAIGTTDWTPWTEFTVAQLSGSDRVTPAVPIPGVPDGSPTISASEFHWAAITGATRYAIEIQHNGLIRAYDEAINAATVCNAGNCQYVKLDAARFGENRWRLRAGSSSAFSQWSEWRDFVIE